MPALRHSATYQGYPGSACQLRWDVGLEPCSGWIDLQLEDVKEILINVNPVPWGGNVFPGMMSIKASQSARGTVTSQPGAPVRQGSGFANYGDLVLKSYDGQGPWHTPITYKDLFIAEGGLEEIQRNLGRVRLHQEGKIRVQLSDVRMFYRKHGALLQRFNVRRPGGEFEQLTMKRTGSTAAGTGNDGGGPLGDTAGVSLYGNTDTTVVQTSTPASETFAPWTAQEIMRSLFLMLPGAPMIDNTSDFMKDRLEPPVDIVGEGEPVVEWIAKLLAQYGYEAHLLPDSRTYLLMKVGKKADYGKIATAAGQWEPVSNVHYERKTIWIKNRPPTVSVIGKRRVRRISMFYEPVFQSADDGMIYKLSAVGDIYGYSLDKVNKQVAVGHEKNFRDVPPVGTAQGFRRGQSLRKCAYRMYAPASAFKGDEIRATIQDLQRQPFMPMKKCPVYLDELRAWFGHTQDAEEHQSGDKGPFVLVSPIVRAYRYGQGFFKDYPAIQQHFDSVMNFVDRELKWAETMQKWVDVRLENPGLLKPNEQLAAGYGDAAKFFSDVVRESLKAKLDDQMLSASNLSPSLTKDAAANTMKQEELAALKPVTQHEVELAKQSIENARAWQAAVKAEFGKYTAAFAQGGGAVLKCQLPWGLVERGHYSMNTQTGVVMFSDPACRLLQPFLLDNDNGEVRADGDVTVTFAYELNTNTPLDFTTVSFSADEKNADDEPKVAVVSLCYPTATPAHCEHASSLQLYEDQTGVPFNQTACITEAASYATGVLKVPHRVEGYTYELDGLRAAVLEGGVSSVQHTWENSGLAYTHVMVNSPYTRGVLPGRRRDTWVSSVEDRRRIESSKGNEER